MRRKEMAIFTAKSDQLFLLIFECLECINKASAHEPCQRGGVKREGSHIVTGVALNQARRN